MEVRPLRCLRLAYYFFVCFVSSFLFSLLVIRRPPTRETSNEQYSDKSVRLTANVRNMWRFESCNAKRLGGPTSQMRQRGRSKHKEMSSSDDWNVNDGTGCLVLVIYGVRNGFATAGLHKNTREIARAKDRALLARNDEYDLLAAYVITRMHVWHGCDRGRRIWPPHIWWIEFDVWNTVRRRFFYEQAK